MSKFILNTEIGYADFAMTALNSYGFDSAFMQLASDNPDNPDFGEFAIRPVVKLNPNLDMTYANGIVTLK